MRLKFNLRWAQEGPFPTSQFPDVPGIMLKTTNYHRPVEQVIKLDPCQQFR